MKIRNTYILLVTIIGLFTLALYSTFAMFTASIDTDEFVSISASNLPTDTSMLEYERLTIEAGDSKIIDLNINNKTTNSLYYGVWYEMIEPTTINDNIVIAKLEGSTDETIGSIINATSKKVTVIIKNNISDSITINLGVAYSKTSSLNLPINRQLVTEVASLNLDTSGANTPKLTAGLIPVMYNGTAWVKAASSNDNETYKWYDYSNKQWANAVLVTSINRSKYVNASIGTVIPESDVLAYYVWIPRYKYKVWNINKKIGTDSYSARTKGIDIQFENGTASTGTIKCNYDFSITNGYLSEICSGSNGEYYTHPAFTFGDKEVEGIWVGKFEVSNSISEIRIKPNVASLRNISLSYFYSAIKNMQGSGNVYGLLTDETQVDSHMLKNMEWGVVAYLTNSNYGRCSNGTCSEVSINKNANYMTGGSNYVSNIAQSTTGNIYGIYDISGGSMEFVMGNMSKETGRYIYDASNAESNYNYSVATAKYLDTYAYGSSYDDQIAYNRTRLGDATGEVISSTGKAWYSDAALLVVSSQSWFERGGYCQNWLAYGGNQGIFYFGSEMNGWSNEYTSSRATLIVF